MKDGAPEVTPRELDGGIGGEEGASLGGPTTTNQFAKREQYNELTNIR